MQARNFLCCLLLLLGAVQLIEARGGGGGRIGGFGGRGGIFSGWFKSSKSSSSSPMSSSSSSVSSASTSNGGVKWNRQSYSPYSGYHSMSYPSSNSGYKSGYNNGYNNDYKFGSSYQSLDNDEYAGFSTGLQTTRFVNDLMQLLKMRLPNDDPETITEETFTIKPSDILEVDRSMNISAFFNLIQPIADKIFERMGARLAKRRQSTPTTTTTPTSQAEITATSQEVDEKGNVANVSEEDVTSTKRPASIGKPRTTLPWSKIICDLMKKNVSKTIQNRNRNRNCSSVTDSIQAISTESLNVAGSAGDVIGDMTPSVIEIQTLQLQSAGDAVASDSLHPVLKTMQQKQPRKIFNVPDEMF